MIDNKQSHILGTMDQKLMLVLDDFNKNIVLFHFKKVMLNCFRVSSCNSCHEISRLFADARCSGHKIASI